jgi:hypothetical protein
VRLRLAVLLAALAILPGCLMQSEWFTNGNKPNPLLTAWGHMAEGSSKPKE